MGDKSPQNQYKIGNLTVKLNPNNQQKQRKDSNYDYDYDKNYHRERHNDKYNKYIDNNFKHRKKEIDELTGKATWRYQDRRGNTVITDEWTEKIVTVYSYPKNLNDGLFIPKGGH